MQNKEKLKINPDSLINRVALSHSFIDDETLDYIISKIENTDFNKHVHFFKFLKKCREDGQEVTIDLIKSMFHIKPEGDPSREIVYFFLSELDKQYTDYKIQEAAILGDYETIEKLLKSKASSFEIESISLSNFLEQYKEREQKHSTIKLGIPELDEVVGGVYSTSTVVVGGGPGAGKTAFAVNILYNTIKQGKNVLFITLETAPEIVHSAVLSRHSFESSPQIELSRIVKYELTESEKIALTKLAQDVEKFPGKYKILSAASFRNFLPSTIDAVIEKVRGELGSIDVIIVDYVQCFRYFCHNENNIVPFVNNTIRYFSTKAIIDQDQPVVFLLSQINREGIKFLIRKRRAEVFLLAEFNELERCAHQIIILHSSDADRLANQELFAVPKNRTGTPVADLQSFYCDFRYSFMGQSLNIISSESMSELAEDIGFGLDDEEDLF